ncbi:hypothetical protein E2320_022709 [Naja naja]|nr:hypothetical protein E2320_022709 [Naja naja]
MILQPAAANFDGGEAALGDSLLDGDANPFPQSFHLSELMFSGETLVLMGDLMAAHHTVIYSPPLAELLEENMGTSQRESVSQAQSHMEILEGEDATLPCDFKTISYNLYLYWYRQYGNHTDS